VTARFCLACGARLTTVVEEGHRRRRCPRCGWTYYANPVPATAAVIGVGIRHATLIGFANDVSELRWFPLDKIPTTTSPSQLSAKSCAATSLADRNHALIKRAG
jgi:hypothetical protein